MSVPRAATPQEYAYARRRAREFGPFFDSDDADDNGRFITMCELTAEQIRDRGSEVCARLGTNEARVGVSTWQFGLMARVCSVALGMVGAGAVVPELSGVAVDEQNRIELPRQRGHHVANADEAVDAFSQEVTESLDPLNRRIHEASAVALQLLRGNTAAALAAAGRVMLAAREPGPGMVEPMLVERILGGTALGATMAGAFPDCRRRTCCLFYRVPGGGYCGDCPLPRRPDQG